MSKQRYVNTRFWHDEYISNLDPLEKLLFLYCITSPATNISGAYELPLKNIATDTGLDKDMLIKLFGRFENDNKIIYRDGWVFALNFIKHQKMQSKLVQIGVMDNILKAPMWIRNKAVELYGEGILLIK